MSRALFDIVLYRDLPPYNQRRRPYRQPSEAVRSFDRAGRRRVIRSNSECGVSIAPCRYIARGSVSSQLQHHDDDIESPMSSIKTRSTSSLTGKPSLLEVYAVSLFHCFLYHFDPGTLSWFMDLSFVSHGVISKNSLAPDKYFVIWFLVYIRKYLNHINLKMITDKIWHWQCAP